MSKITKLDKTTARVLGTEIEAEIRKLLADRGLSVDFGGGTVGDTELNLKLRIRVTDIAAVADKERADFERVCYGFGLAPKHYGVVFQSQGASYKIVGLDARRPKFPVKAIRLSDGKAFKMTDLILNRVRDAAADIAA